MPGVDLKRGVDPGLGEARDSATPNVIRHEESRLGWFLVLPVLIVVAVLVLYPLGFGFSMSLRSIIFGSGIPDHFVGLRNYQDVVTSSSTTAAAVHTAGYLIGALVLEVAAGLGIALLLNRSFKGRGLVFAVLILPWALPSVVSAILWQRLFAPNASGLLNSLLLDLHVISAPHVWLASTTSAIFLITLLHVWGVIPLTSLIFLSGLQSIPDDLLAASAVDGATPFRQFRHITLPLLRPALAVALTTGTVVALAIFDEIYVLNGAALNTRSVMMQVYLTTFQDLDFGHGTALAFLLTGVTTVFGIVYIRGLRRVEH